MQTDESASREICHYNLASIRNLLLSGSLLKVGIGNSSAAAHIRFGLKRCVSTLKKDNR